MVNKVVINNCYGGYGLSLAALKKLVKTKSPLRDLYSHPSQRSNKNLIKVVEELGKKASGTHAELIVVEVDSKRYRICEYDGKEWVETPTSIEWYKF